MGRGKLERGPSGQLDVDPVIIHGDREFVARTPGHALRRIEGDAAGAPPDGVRGPAIVLKGDMGATIAEMAAYIDGGGSPVIAGCLDGLIDRAEG